MGSNMASLVGKENTLGKWFRLFSPSSKLRFYPPKFTIRNPLIRAVQTSFYYGYEVAVLVFNIKEWMEIKKSHPSEVYGEFAATLKQSFKDTALDKIPEEDLLIVHDYHGDGVTVLMRVTADEKQWTVVDETVRLIAAEVEQRMKKADTSIPLTFQTGYMFIENKYYSIEEAVNKAHQQAVAMAESESPMNEMKQVIERIINHQEIHLLAQPIFHVATNRIEAYEVLTRGPRGTDLESPLSLFAVARQTGHLYELEKIVLEKSFRQIAENESSQNVFINFTPITLSDPRFLKDVTDMLEACEGIRPQQIVLEITERDRILNLENFVNNIRALRALGFRVAIDDTGVGYSSLAAILEIMPEIIKIDRSVIENIDHNSVKESMLKGLLLIAKEAGSVVVAEGIESIGEAMVLSRNKVDLAQGYYYARPSTVDKIPLSS